MLQNEAWETVSDIIDSTDFYRAAPFKNLFGYTESSLEDNPFDVITLGEWLDNRQELEKVGGMGISRI